LVLTIISLAQIAILSPKRLVFSSQLVGATSSTKKVILENTDSVNALTITSISASGNFTETSTCHGRLNPLASCAISVNFAPTGVGIIDGAITIVDSAPNWSIWCDRRSFRTLRVRLEHREIDWASRSSS
jgi:hypothetical protein